jgi:hypothetical protein
MNSWTILLLWVSSQALHLILGVRASRYSSESSGRKRLVSLLVSRVASIFSLITLVLFVLVFVIGGSSNVAQLAGETGYSLWSLWFHVWPLLILGNIVAFLAILVTVFLPPYPPYHWGSFASRACALISASISLYTVVTFFPTA